MEFSGSLFSATVFQEVFIWSLFFNLWLAACNCNTFGSYTKQCNYTTGDCRCRPNIRGIQCDRCEEGMVGFPTCVKCDCNPDGTRFLPGLANNVCYGSAKVNVIHFEKIDQMGSALNLSVNVRAQLWSPCRILRQDTLYFVLPVPFFSKVYGEGKGTQLNRVKLAGKFWFSRVILGTSVVSRARMHETAPSGARSQDRVLKLASYNRFFSDQLLLFLIVREVLSGLCFKLYQLINFFQTAVQ